MHLVRTQDVRRTWVRRIALVAAGSLLFTLGAKMTFAIGIVPITFQPLALAVVAALLGPALGTAAALVYLAEGFAGAPVFASAGVLGPTLGYLLAYPAATMAVGALYDRGARAHYATRFAAQLAGLAIVYACGAAVLSVYVGAEKAIALGVAPFVALDLAKLGLASFVRTRIRA